LSTEKTFDKEEIRKEIIEGLRNIYDPEMPINIVDLGLIYEIHISDDLQILIKYTLTVPGCPLASMLDSQIIETVRRVVPNAKDIRTEVVFDPPWTPLRISPEGREKLKEVFGFDIVEEWMKKFGMKQE